MKTLRISLSVCFFALLMLPVLLLNHEEYVVSEIDNRILTNNPFGSNYICEDGEFDLSDALEAYLQDRIGFRDEMIYSYTVMHDRLFHEMVHPSYEYGQDGYVFSKFSMNREFGEYHVIFADMVKKIQDYCEARGVPFLFVFEPSKASILSDKLSPGINYNNEWVRLFREALDERGVKYVDNSELLWEKYEQGEMVFNKKYNAGHWNDLGAFYGVNNVLEVMKKDFPAVHINSKDEFEVEQHLNTSLQVSKFPIYEYEPVFHSKCILEDITDDYDDEIDRDERYPHFGYVVNEQRVQEDSPKTLVFQGSYMNEMGYKFFGNSLGEYISIHDYQNVINFDYYYNIFKPDYVIFEVAEYVFTEEYFSSGAMIDLVLNPLMDSFKENDVTVKDIDSIQIETESGDKLYKIKVYELPDDIQYAYIESGGKVFDLKKYEESEETWFEAVIEKKYCHKEDFSVAAVDVVDRMVKYK